MDRDQDVEVELYEENVGNLNYSTPTGSRSSSQDRFPPVLSSQEPTQRRLEEILFVAIDPRPDPEELSHAPTSQVPRIHDSCHSSNIWMFADDTKIWCIIKEIDDGLMLQSDLDGLVKWSDKWLLKFNI